MPLSLIGAYALLALLAAIALNLVYQLLFRMLVRTRPPLVFHWIPFLGSTVHYGTDPYGFSFSCREKYGDIFTFVLLGCHTTVYLGTQGNEFILNGKLKDVNVEEVYRPLTIPVFGSDVVYDCPNSKLMEQKKSIKFGLTQSALESHVALIEKEVLEYLEKSPNFQGTSGEVDISTVMAEITIFTAGSALQGEEVRSKLTAEFAALYHDLDKGFSPINFMLPWAPPGLGNSQVDIAKMAPSGYKLSLLSVFSISSSTSPRTQTSTDPIRKQRKADHLHLQFDTTTNFQSPMPLSTGPTHRVPRADE